MQADDFRTFLGARYCAAKQRNPRFSLRAFARGLGVDHSTLSQILRGKRRLTAAQASRMGKRLGLAAEAIQSPDSAILELTRVDGFTADSRWIAKTLGVPVADVNIAVQRLLRLQLLEMTDRNRWVDKSGKPAGTR